MGYVPYPVQVDPAAVVEQVLADLRARTGAALNEGHPLVAAIEAVAYRIAESRVVQADIAATIFAFFGDPVAGVARIAAAAATVEATVTAVDSAGYTLPAGTRVSRSTTGDQRVGFETVAAVTIPPGSTTGTVTLRALVPGVAANGLPAGPVQLVDQVAWLASIVTLADTAGGVDEESGEAYVDRLSAETTLFSRVPRLENEFALAARRIAGVHRARDIRTYDAENDLQDQPGHVTVAVVDATGGPVPAPVKSAVEVELSSDDRRALNVVVHVIDPTLQEVVVDFDAVAAAGADPVVVEAAAIAAVEAYLNPATWAGGADSPPVWRPVDTVRYLEVAAVLDRVEGLDYVTALTIDGGTADVGLSGVAVLPDLTVTGSVS